LFRSPVKGEDNASQQAEEPLEEGEGEEEEEEAEEDEQEEEECRNSVYNIQGYSKRLSGF